MSTPEATGVRQRSSLAEEHKNPDSLSMKSDKRANTKKTPTVKPPLADVSMNKFMTYMVLGLVALAAFYTWRFTVWAGQAGGYWNLMTGRTATPKSSVADTAAFAASAASSAKAGAKVAASSVGKGSAVKSSEGDVQSQILQLANSLGIKPAELSAALRPLIDPSVPNAAAQAQKELEMLKLQQQGGGAQEAEHTGGAGVLGVLGEALLD